MKADSELAKNVNQKYAIIKETERPKLRPKTIVDKMKKDGFSKFDMHQHTLLWQAMDAKNLAKGFGTDVEGTWFWYEAWLDQVRDHCTKNSAQFE